jgi:hypothetical protein
MLDQLIISHVAAGQLGFKAVEGVESVALLASVPVARPACFVLPALEDYRATQESAGLIVIEVTASFDVVVMVDGAATRGQRAGELETLRTAVVDRLLGWTPDASLYRPFVPTSGRLLGIENGRASHVTRFRTVYRLRRQGL